ncbi:hypothetical protein VNO77_04164 [Canavalia gladiata]|uniref:Hexosyltransferase n=1 Tax=Canavalia gladiata TaxID=3824 RepID=A0AAN9N1P9_CANGL
MLPFQLNAFVSLTTLCFLVPPFSLTTWSFPTGSKPESDSFPRFDEAPDYRNGIGCPVSTNHNPIPSCNPSLAHIAMTLDSDYLRGTIVAVHSVLRHATFPSLNHRFKVYIFKEDTITYLISSSVRRALENPLNYARNYLGDILDQCVDRVIYHDSDLVVVDDIRKLWRVTLSESRVMARPSTVTRISLMSLLHWSGKGKPWVRLDANEPYFLDCLWEPYDLYKPLREPNRSWSLISSSLLVGYPHDLL